MVGSIRIEEVQVMEGGTKIHVKRITATTPGEGGVTLTMADNSLNVKGRNWEIDYHKVSPSK